MKQRTDRERRKLAADCGSMQDVLEARLPDETLRLAVTRIWLDSGRDPEEFVARIRKHHELSPQADEIRFTVEVAERVERNLELVQALERCFDANDQVWKPEDLAAWDISTWKTLIETERIAVPDALQSEGGSNDSTHKFAVHLRNTFEHIYPGRAIREHFRRSASSYKWGEVVRTMLDEHPEIDPSIPVTRLVREHPDLFERDDAQLAQHGLATFQRLRRLTGTIAPIQSLVHAGLDSARAIAQAEPDAFAEQFGAAFIDSSASAAVVHTRATRISALTNETLASWRCLLGSEDLGFCECAHCRSIYGSSAYLFDMLLFLDRFLAPSQNTDGPTSARRVDCPGQVNSSV